MFWWAYEIAEYFSLDPREVKNWNGEEVFEALAFMKWKDDRTPKPK